MIKSVPQIDSKGTACCYSIQPIENWLVPRMLAAGANMKLAPVVTFRKTELCNLNSSFIPSSFLFLYFQNSPHQFNKLASPNLFRSN